MGEIHENTVEPEKPNKLAQAVKLLAGEVPGSNLDQDIIYFDWGFLWHSSTPPGTCYESA
jgi:hypothetical protein